MWGEEVLRNERPDPLNEHGDESSFIHYTHVLQAPLITSLSFSFSLYDSLRLLSLCLSLSVYRLIQKITSTVQARDDFLRLVLTVSNLTLFTSQKCLHLSFTFYWSFTRNGYYFSLSSKDGKEW